MFHHEDGHKLMRVEQMDEILGVIVSIADREATGARLSEHPNARGFDLRVEK